MGREVVCLRKPERTGEAGGRGLWRKEGRHEGTEGWRMRGLWTEMKGLWRAGNSRLFGGMLRWIWG